MAFIQTTDFLGDIKISQNSKESADLQSYIDQTQERVLRNLLGDSEYNLFIADLVAGVPQTQKWLNFLNGFTWVDDSDYDNNYTGIKQFLRYFTYFEFVRNLNAKTTTIGIQFADAENSLQATQIQSNVVTEQRYNKGVDLYKEATKMLLYYEKRTESYTTITEIGAGTYQVALSRNIDFVTLSDTVTILATDYTVTGVDYGLSTFNFTAAAGLTFADNGQVTWQPFPKLQNEVYNWSVMDGFL
jgi:hypothetical protein